MRIQPVNIITPKFLKRTVIPALVLSGAMLSACTTIKQEVIGMPNPWIECNTGIQKAAKVAGFGSPLVLSDCKIRAMKDMIEVTYPLDKERDVIVRKSAEYEGIGDISGDYNKYPVNEKKELFDSVWADFRRDNDKIYVVNFSAESGFYSINCPKGMSLDEVKNIYEMIATVETQRIPQCPE